MRIAKKKGIKIGDYSYSKLYPSIWASSHENELETWVSYLNAEVGTVDFFQLSCCFKDQVKAFNRV